MSRQRPTSALIRDQIRYQNRIFWRTPIAAFFTLAFPVLLLVLFGALFGNQPDTDSTAVVQYFAPNLAVFAAVSATFTNLGIGTAIARDRGILKRVRGTPLPAWVYIAGRIGSAAYIAVLAVGMMLGLGVAVYGIRLDVAGIPAALLAFLAGVFCFSALGLMVASLAPSGDSTPAITNATLLPLAFVSDIFIPMSNPPRWMEIVGDVFPLKHFAVAFREPLAVGSPTEIPWLSLLVMMAWGVGAFLIASRTFRWDPRERGSGSPRRARVTGR